MIFLVKIYHQLGIGMIKSQKYNVMLQSQLPYLYIKSVSPIDVGYREYL